MESRLLIGVLIAAGVVAAALVLAGSPRATGEEGEGAKAGATRPAGPPVIRKGAVAARLRQRGAMLIEPFDGDKVDQRRWRIWTQDPDAVAFEVRDGRYHLRGTGPIGHNGLWSLNPARFKDVTLVARMDVRSEGPHPHDFLLHLCGGDMPNSPDHWVEISMQDAGEKASFRVLAAVEKGLYKWPAEPVVLARGKEDGFVARLSLNAATNLCTAEVRDADGKWRLLLDPLPLHLRTTHCEVKMRGQGIPRGAKPTTSSGWFDDVRIYPRAESNPPMVRLVMADGGPIFSRPDESQWPPKIVVAGQRPRSLEDLVVELWTADGKTRICKVQSPHFAHYMLPLTGAPWDLYPVAAKIRLSIDGQPLGEADIPCSGLEGLYPDDVYDVIVE